MELLLMEYDRTKRDPKCSGCDRFYRILDDATAEDIKNITQITPRKAKVKVSDAVMDKYKERITEKEIDPIKL